MKPPGSILVVKTSSIGDVILTTPVAEALKQAYPACHISWLVEDRTNDILVGNPFIDQVITWERRRMRELRKGRQWTEWRQEFDALRSQITARHYDYLIDLQGFDRTLLVHLAARARKRVFLPGPDRWRGYTKHIWERRPLVHAIEYHLETLRSAGLGISDTSPPMRFYFESEDKEHARRLLEPWDTKGHRIAINPLTTWPAKEWQKERYIELARRLVEELDARVILIGDQAAGAACRQMAEAIGPRALNLAGQTSLKQLAALLTHCRCLVTADSGPMHLAGAVGVPVAALFGPTHPANYGPRGPEDMVFYRSLECSPCRNKYLVNPTCMTEIEVEAVFARLRNLLQPSLISITEL